MENESVNQVEVMLTTRWKSVGQSKFLWLGDILISSYTAHSNQRKPYTVTRNIWKTHSDSLVHGSVLIGRFTNESEASQACRVVLEDFLKVLLGSE